MPLEWDDDLRRGIWPRSTIVWVTAFWTALLIIRPWEIMFPWMADLRFELVYSLFALALLFASGQFRIVSSMQNAGVIVWFLAMAVSCAFALNPALAWEDLYVYATRLLLFFVLVSAIRTPYQLLFIVTCFVVSTGLFLTKSQVEYHFFGASRSSMGVIRLTGDNLEYGHPNALAALSVISLPLGLFLWKARHEFTHTWPRFWCQAFTYGLVVNFVVVVSSIILSNSRTGIVAFGGFILLVASSNMNLSRILVRMAGGLVLLATIWMLMPGSTRHRMETLWAPIKGDAGDESAVLSAEGRKIGSRLGMEMFWRFPVTGVGLGNFVYYRKLFLDGGHLVAHNSYVAVLAETGAVGGAAYLFFIAGIFANAHQTNRLAKLIPVPMVQLLARLAVACRQAIVLFLFVGIAGDYQRIAPPYWIAAYCLLAAVFARTFAQTLHDRAFAEENSDEDQWPASSKYSAVV